MRFARRHSYSAFLVLLVAAGFVGCGGKSGQSVGLGAGTSDAGAANVAEAGAGAADAGASAQPAAGSTGQSEVGQAGGSQAGASSALETGGGAPTEGCPKQPTVLQSGGTIVTFQTDPYLAGEAVAFGMPNALPGGGTLTPLNFRYYVSNVLLVTGDGQLTPVDLVTAAGALEPYGVHLLNSEDPQSTAWSIRAPAGRYLGIRLTLGLTEACDVFDGSRDAPLSADSQMTWPPPFNYLFLRFEARIEGASSGPDGSPVDGQGQPWDSAIAMGGLQGQPFAPVVAIDAALRVPAAEAPSLRHLRFDLQQMFNGANANVDVGNFPTIPGPIPGGGFGPPGGDETTAGERLRQSAPNLPLFTLDP